MAVPEKTRRRVRELTRQTSDLSALSIRLNIGYGLLNRLAPTVYIAWYAVDGRGRYLLWELLIPRPIAPGSNSACSGIM